MPFPMRKKEGNRLEIDIYNAIYPPLYSAESFRKDLYRGLPGEGTIDLFINSPGGQASEGISILQTLLDHPAEVHVHVHGLAASIASVIAMAAEPGHIEISELGSMMIHNPWVVAAGDAKALRKLADELDLLQRQLVTAYGRHSSLSVEDLREKMDAETWFDAEAAVAAGLASTVKRVGKAQPANGFAADLLGQGLYRNEPPPWVVGRYFSGSGSEPRFGQCEECGQPYEVGQGGDCFLGGSHEAPAASEDQERLRAILAGGAAEVAREAARLRGLALAESFEVGS